MTTSGNPLAAGLVANRMVIMSPGADLELHPDRLLPSEPGLRAIAGQLYETVAEQPITSPPRACAGRVAGAGHTI